MSFFPLDQLKLHHGDFYETAQYRSEGKAKEREYKNRKPPGRTNPLPNASILEAIGNLEVGQSYICHKSRKLTRQVITTHKEKPNIKGKKFDCSSLPDFTTRVLRIT